MKKNTIVWITQDIFDALHVGIQLPFYLTSPNDGTRGWWKVPDMAHTARFTRRILHLEKAFLIQILYEKFAHNCL